MCIRDRTDGVGRGAARGADDSHSTDSLVFVYLRARLPLPKQKAEFFIINADTVIEIEY